MDPLFGLLGNVLGGAGGGLGSFPVTDPFGGFGGTGMPDWMNPGVISAFASNPDGMAAKAAAAGIPPPAAPMPTLGESLTPPAPREGEPDAMGARTTPTAPQGGGAKLLDTLKGLKAPAAPEVQKVSTPAAPRPTGNITGGDLLKLLMGTAPAGAAPKIPYGLGAAIGSR